MPLYDYKCEFCGSIFEALRLVALRETAKCPNCKGEGKKQVSIPNVILFHKGWYENIGPDPIYIDSFKQLGKECKKHGSGSVYLDDSC